MIEVRYVEVNRYVMANDDERGGGKKKKERERGRESRI